MFEEVMIQRDGLTERFGDFTAVDHINSSVGQCSIFVFLGSNGSGRTTAIRMVSAALLSGGWRLFFPVCA
jgi:ribosome-dependent ATPase